MLTQVIFALVNGLTVGMAVFLVAAGVTLVFGILKILNFAHGSFFMIGAYVAYSIIGRESESMLLFAAAAIVAGVAVGALGYVADLAVFRRLRGIDESYTLIATFALLLACDGAVKLIWGVDYHSIYAPELVAGSVEIGPLLVPAFSLFIIAVGLVVYLLLEIAIHRLWIGKVVQALAHDQWMASLAGINVPMIFAGAVVAAFFLAGLAGGLLLPNQSLSPTLGSSYLLQAFVVVIIGGLGNIRGAFLAAILLGLVESLNSVLLPNLPGLAIYFAMVLFLLWRPHGLLAGGQAPPQAVAGLAASGPGDVRVSAWVKIATGAVSAAAVVSLPLWANQGLLFIAGLTLIEALFAISWNLMFGFTGLATFGHAAFFAIGAYFVAVLLKSALGIPFLAMLLGAMVTGGLAAMLVGVVALRRTAGIGLAILTLALSEILRIFITYSDTLGHEDGLSAIRRPVLDLYFVQIGLQSGPAYYWFLCTAFAFAALALRWFTLSSTGRVLRSIRQDPERAAFLGIRVARYRVIAFTIAGMVAALAGGLQAPWSQIVTPDSASYVHSTAPMLNTLLGGAEFFWGPAVGAVLFSALSYGTRTLVGLSELVSGVVLLVIVLAAPTGVLGILARLSMAGRKRPAADASVAT